MARAQQELDRDELEMATEGLERAGGDPQAQIKRLKAIHDAALKDIRPIASSAAADASATTSPGESLVARLRAWNALRDKRAQIAQAEQDANYAQWGALGDGNARAALHRLLWGLLSIAVVLLATFLAARLVDRLYEGVAREQLRAGTLRTVVKFAVQVVGALLILFIVIGVPGQATTILGLAGAGLTVAMKDFIVAFFGWFVLMSKNGIRVGDWVEIEGVGGEVAEIRPVPHGAAGDGGLDRRRPPYRPPGLVREQLRHRGPLLQFLQLGPVDVGPAPAARTGGPGPVPRPRRRPEAGGARDRH